MELIQKFRRVTNGMTHKVLGDKGYITGSVSSANPAGQVAITFSANETMTNDHAVIFSLVDAEAAIKTFAEQLGWIENYEAQDPHLIPDSVRRDRASAVLRRIADRIDAGE